MQEKANKLFKNISIEHEQSKLQLEEHEKELGAREALNKTDSNLLDHWWVMMTQSQM